MAFKFKHITFYAANSKWTILQIIIAIDLYKKQLIHDVSNRLITETIYPQSLDTNSC